MAFVSDTFTDTAGTVITSHTGGTGATWTDGTGSSTTDRAVVTGTVETGSGRLRPGTTTAYSAYSSGVPATADYDVSADLYVAASGTAIAGVTGRMSTTAATHYIGRYRNDTSGPLGAPEWQLIKNVAGVQTVLGEAAETLATGASYTGMRLSMVGTSISLYLGATLKVGPITDSAIAAAGRAGFRMQYQTPTTPGDATGLSLDNFTATDASTGQNVAPSLVTSGPTLYVPTLSAGQVSHVTSIVANASTWTDQAGSSVSADLVTALDDNTATYIKSPGNPAGSGPITIHTGPLSKPNTGNRNFVVGLQKSANTGTMDYTVECKKSGGASVQTFNKDASAGATLVAELGNVASTGATATCTVTNAIADGDWANGFDWVVTPNKSA